MYCEVQVEHVSGGQYSEAPCLRGGQGQGWAGSELEGGPCMVSSDAYDGHMRPSPTEPMCID